MTHLMRRRLSPVEMRTGSFTNTLMEKTFHMPTSSIQALRRSLRFCLLLLGVTPWVVSAYTPVRTEVLFPEPRSWQTGRQGWHAGLTTGFTLLDDVTVLGPGGEVALDLDPGALVVGTVG